MGEKFDVVRFYTIFISCIIYLLGGYDMGIQILLIVIALDYITGILKAIVLKQLNSYIGWSGLCKKTGILISIMVAVQVEYLIGKPDTVHNVIAFAFTINECISIVENLDKIGVKIPKVLTKYLKNLKDSQK